MVFCIKTLIFLSLRAWHSLGDPFIKRTSRRAPHKAFAKAYPLHNWQVKYQLARLVMCLHSGSRRDARTLVRWHFVRFTSQIHGATYTCSPQPWSVKTLRGAGLDLPLRDNMPASFPGLGSCFGPVCVVLWIMWGEKEKKISWRIVALQQSMAQIQWNYLFYFQFMNWLDNLWVSKSKERACINHTRSRPRQGNKAYRCGQHITWGGSLKNSCALLSLQINSCSLRSNKHDQDL